MRSIIMLVMNHGPESDPRTLQIKTNCGAISLYACNHDYTAASRAS